LEVGMPETHYRYIGRILSHEFRGQPTRTETPHPTCIDGGGGSSMEAYSLLGNCICELVPKPDLEIVILSLATWLSFPFFGITKV
jgi:hypothetical protein